ncbi:MAG: GntR family transcriptional regulator [Pseudomonadota bacterium]
MESIDRSKRAVTPWPTASRAEAQAEPLQVRLLHYVKEQNLPRGAHLKEQTLANAMGVSRTPIRKALALLEEAGVVESRPHRGFVLLAPASGLMPAAVELPVTDDRQLFDRIALDRLNGSLNETFSDDEIVSRYAVSRRMALRVLTELRDENIVAAVAAGRFRFNETLATAESSDASYAFRLCLEPQIPLLNGFSPSADAIRRCRSEHLQFLDMDQSQRTNRLAYRLDADFHEMLAEASRNQFFYAAIVQQNRLRQLLEYRDYNNQARVLVWCQEHLEILDAVESGNRKLTSRKLRQHLLNAMEYRPHARHGQTA